MPHHSPPTPPPYICEVRDLRTGQVVYYPALRPWNSTTTVILPDSMVRHDYKGQVVDRDPVRISCRLRITPSKD
jgi:hypothetical protein